MIRKIWLVLVILFVASSLFGQSLTIVDSETKIAIRDVAIYNLDKSKSALTDEQGKVDVSRFTLKEEIYFQHPSYIDIILTKEQLRKLNWKVSLTKQIVEIDEFVISAYRWEQKANEIPNKIKRITQKEIEFANPQTTADLLSGSSEVFVQKSQLGGGSPMIRGFSTSSVLLVVDGVRMNNAIYREGNLQNVISLDANSIESSEIIFGPGSVTYGSDALGGVMDFHTLKLNLSTTEEKQFSGAAFVRYSSANQEKTGHLDFNLGCQKMGFLTSITYSSYDDLRMGSNNNADYVRSEYVKQINGVDSIVTNNDENVQIHSGYDQINVMQKVRYRPNEKLDFNYTFHYSRLSDVPRYDRLIQYSGEELKYGEWYYGPQKWMMHSLNVEYLNANRLFDKAKIITAYQDYEESRHDRKYRKINLRERTENVKAYSLSLDFDKNFKSDNHIFYGLEAVYNSVKSTGQNKNLETGEITPESTRYPDGENNYNTLAAYVGYKDNLSEKLTLISGIRANYVSIYSTIQDTSFFDFPFDEIQVSNSALNGSLGLAFRPTNKWQINLNLSSGFHAPNIDDIAKVFDSEPGNVVVPNDDLKPEYAYNVDLAIQKKFWNFIDFNITGFYTYLTNAFVRRDFMFNGQDSIVYDGQMSKVQAIVNADKAFIYGVSSSIDIKLSSKLNLNSIINYTKGEDQDGIALRHVSPLFGNTKLTYTDNKFSVSVYANYNGEISYSNLASSEQSKAYMYAIDKNGNPYSPAWWTLNIMTSYNIKNVGTLSLGIDNIFDNRYRPYSSGIAAPGINLIVGLRANF